LLIFISNHLFHLSFSRCTTE